MSPKPRISAAVPRGVQTFLFEDAHRRAAVSDQLFDVIRAWSYGEIALPVFDFFEVFSEVASNELVEMTYRFVDREGQLVAVRSDFTPLVAKVVATRLSHHPLPLRLCYRGDVVRHQPPRGGAQSDFWQLGAELIGAEGVSGDLEILAVVADALDASGVENFSISLGHAAIFDALIDAAGSSPKDADRIRVAVDRKDVAALDGAPKALQELPTLVGGRDVLVKARTAWGSVAAEGLDELDALAAAFDAAGLPGRLVFDLGDVRGTGYYTGMKFHVHALGVGASLGDGGRYDQLVGRFGDDRPAVGFSLSLDRIAHLLRGGAKVDAAEVRPFAVGNDLAASIRDARAARQGGSKVEIVRS